MSYFLYIASLLIFLQLHRGVHSTYQTNFHFHLWSLHFPPLFAFVFAFIIFVWFCFRVTLGLRSIFHSDQRSYQLAPEPRFKFSRILTFCFLFSYFVSVSSVFIFCSSSVYIYRRFSVRIILSFYIFFFVYSLCPSSFYCPYNSNLCRCR